jgi:hypothetical protein
MCKAIVYVCSVHGEKQASTPCKKRGHADPKVSLVDSNIKRSDQQFNSKKDSIVQQEDKFMQQVDKENDEVCNVTMDHHVTPTPKRVAIPKCRLQSNIVKEEVTNILITGSLSSEQDQEENSLAHATGGELEEATIPSCEIREYLSLLEANDLSVEFKEHATVLHHANVENDIQEAP